MNVAPEDIENSCPNASHVTGHGNRSDPADIISIKRTVNVGILGI
jgi:hypothetical protein